MLKPLKLALSACALLLCIALPVGATDYTYCADALFDMNLFFGSDDGYELDRAPSRAESAVMLVRLLGKTADATSTSPAHPFADVPQWADAYVGWLFQNKLTNGESATSFGSDNPCSLTAYCTFMLRALGYRDTAGGDFTLGDDLIPFATGLNLIDTPLTKVPFTRNEMVAISYSALALPLKGSSTLLAEKLNREGVLSQETAKPHLDGILAYKKVIASTNSLPSSVSLKVTTQTPFLANNDIVEISTSEIAFSSVINGSTVIQSYSEKLDGGTKHNFFYLNGYMYSIDHKEKWKDNPFSVGSKNDAVPYYYVNSITTSLNNSGETVVYTVSYFDHISSVWDTLRPVFGELTAMADIFILDRNGELTSKRSEATLVTKNSRNQLFSRVDVLARGSNVRLSLPDFTNYVDLTEHMGNK